MARAGRVYLFGSGENKMNPIHGADLAKVCVDAVTGKEHDVPVGGPVIYSYKGIAELAFAALGKKPKISRIPSWLAKLAVKPIRLFNKQVSDIAEFYVAASQNDVVAPTAGTHTLQSYYEELALRLLGEKGRQL